MCLRTVCLKMYVSDLRRSFAVSECHRPLALFNCINLCEIVINLLLQASGYLCVKRRSWWYLIHVGALWGLNIVRCNIGTVFSIVTTAEQNQC